MKIIKEQSNIFKKIVSQQKVDISKKYRWFTYISSLQIDGGLLLYNNLTEELILLVKSEIFKTEGHLNFTDTNKSLIEKWFLVPEDFKDAEFANGVDKTLEALNATKKPDYIDTFTILTTTECNARCFYCYEHDRKKFPMTRKTAYDVAKYIIRESKGHSVRIKWFGGEPLYNLEVIDIITQELVDHNVEFRSSMITNGYLFNQSLIQRAKTLWNLKAVQITLDGTKDIYNRTKNFIYKHTNPFETVLNNIEHILENGLSVTIRMNMDDHNADDLFSLVDCLAERFARFNNITLYSHLLFDETSSLQANRSESERMVLQQRHLMLKKHIDQRFGEKKYTVNRYRNINHCMADLDTTAVIAPDGKLGKCEHFSESHFWGSIYSNKRDTEMINIFKKHIKLSQRCDSCKLMPSCNNLEACPDRTKDCSAAMQQEYFFNIEQRILNTYKSFIKKTELSHDK